MIARYRHVRGEVLAVGFADDAFATAAGTRRLLEAFPGLHATSVTIVPSQLGMSAIGHFGLFRRSAEASALAPGPENASATGRCSRPLARSETYSMTTEVVG